jgi:hypothetical protein
LRSLEAIMASLGIGPSAVKDSVMVVAERLGRLKGNGSVVRRSPLTNVVELEALLVGIRGKEALWSSLLLLADAGGPLDGRELAGLVDRARVQRETVEACRLEAARLVFGGTGPRRQSSL